MGRNDSTYGKHRTATRRAFRQLSSAQLCIALLAIGLVFLATSPGGARLALATLASGLAVFGVGYSIVRVAGFSWRPSATLAIAAFPCGLIACCGVAQAFHHNGLPQLAFWTLVLVLAITGLSLAWRDLRGKWAMRVACSWWYLALALFLGFTMYFPKAHYDSVYGIDGSVTWLHVDSPFHEALANVLVAEKPPLRNPGFGLAPMYYHYGRHALAALVSTAFGLSVSDSFTRSNHFLGVTALAFACIALGRATARRPRNRALAGLLAPCLLCLPNIFALFLDCGDPAARHPLASYFPDLIDQELRHRCAEGFLALGWSDLWGSLLSVTVASLLSLGSNSRSMNSQARLPLPALLVAVLGIPVNGLVALVCVFVVIGSAVLRRPSGRSLAFAALALALFWAFRRAVNLQHVSVGTGGLDIGGMLFRLARIVSVGGAVLLGLRGLCILNFAWGSRETKIAIFLFAGGFMGLDLVFNVQSSYPNLFLMLLLSAYAAAPLSVLMESWWHGPASFAAAMGACGRVYRNYLLVLLLPMAVFLPICWFPYLRHFTVSHIYGVSVSLAIAVPLCALGYCWLTLAIRRDWTLGRLPAGLAFALVLALSFGGFLRFQLAWNWDWLGTSVSVDAPRVRSLAFVCDRVPPGVLLATTRHFVDVGATPERSYVYSTLTHRYCFVEGWGYGDPASFPGFAEIRHDNELIFTTPDPDVAKSLIQKHGITHLLVEPDKPLGFDAARVAWLHRLVNPGSLTVYEVEPAAALSSERPH